MSAIEYSAKIIFLFSLFVVSISHNNNGFADNASDLTKTGTRGIVVRDDSNNDSSDTSSNKALCSLDNAIKIDGRRQLALIVGIGKYKNVRVPSLPGASADALRMYDFLTDEQSFAFPKSNVCMLIDSRATKQNVIDAFRTLTDRADSGDSVVFYYAGHGSQVRDSNLDESDGMDETFLVYDARTKDNSGRAISDLRDDTFNTLLAALHKKTQNITVILDSCNSGTATRGTSEGGLIARFFEPDTTSAETEDPDSIGDGSNWIPENLDGMVVMSGAVDGTPALEKNGKGVFTDALIGVLSRPSTVILSYRQVARLMAPVVKASSYQIIQFHGDLDRPFFGNKKANTVSGWEILSLDADVKIGGAPMVGMGVGAELRVYPSASTADVVSDPQKSKATLKVIETDGIEATSSVISRPENADEISPGDLVIMLRPAISTLSVRIRPVSEKGGVSTDRANSLKASLSANGVAKSLLEFNDRGDFEIAQGYDGDLQLWGPENKLRKIFSQDNRIIENIILHAKQRAILQMRSEGGADYQENETLKGRIIPALDQDACSRESTWVQAEDNATQIIPLCHKWNLQVTVSPEAKKPLLIGGVLLSTDGSIYGFPADGRKELVRPGDTVTFAGRNETFRALPPLDQQDQVLFFGTDQANPVDWHTLTNLSRGVDSNSLQRTFKTFVNQPTRGFGVASEATDNTQSWTRSIVPFRVEANSRFAEDKPDSDMGTREYTIPNFDVRPYLPDDTNSPLYKVLIKADSLAKSSKKDGFRYKQHGWTQDNDAANLALGVDCSRAIWFAFTRAGLTYNDRDNAYLPTADMVTRKTAMKDQFDSCPTNESFKTGDILVYRDSKRGDGHVVMVVDVEKRIAWGSHGWDGNARILPVEPDTGVEYQKIKIKKDWQRWDRSTMTLKNCWRYKGFNQQVVLGQKALKNTCQQDWCSD
ncbi:MAG: hypothetical protein ACI82Z_000404 [Cellvibrionaceae bacterium]|jgi:hypothetical protein